MSYLKTKSNVSGHSRTLLYNPEFAYSHMERMHNLLQSYDVENNFLTKQVAQLLSQKRLIESKYADLQSRDNQGKSWKGILGQQNPNLKKGVRNFMPNEPRNKKYEFGSLKNGRQNQTFKEINKFNPKVQSSSAKNSRVFFHEPSSEIIIEKIQEDGSQSQEIQKKNNVVLHQTEPFPKTQPKQQINLNIPSNNIKQQQPEIATKLPNDEQLKKPSEFTLSSANLVTVLKRDAYITSSNRNNTSIDTSRQKQKINSPKLSDSKKSNKSKKQGIQVVSVKKQNDDRSISKIVMPEIGRKQETQVESLKKQVIVEEVVKMPECLIKLQVKEEGKYQYQLKKEPKYFDEKAPKSLVVTPKKFIKEENPQRHSIIAGQSHHQFIERQPSFISQVRVKAGRNSQSFFLPSRTQSQHRIQPSEKIVYSEKTPSKKKDNQVKCKELSKDGKKKFISIVSNSAILAQKLSFKQKNNSVDK